MKTRFINKNKVVISIIIFIIIFALIIITKPNCFFKKDGSLRIFGLGRRNKTIFPLWLFSITLGIIIYLILMYILYYVK